MDYAYAVIDALTEDFPDLREPDVAEIVIRSIEARSPEIIVDDPFSANWRLIPKPDNFGRTGRVRLACWRVMHSQANRERLSRLNAALDAIPVPAAGAGDENGG